jgi:hypothetical protein
MLALSAAICLSTGPASVTSRLVELIAEMIVVRHQREEAVAIRSALSRQCHRRHLLVTTVFGIWVRAGGRRREHRIWIAD